MKRVNLIPELITDLSRTEKLEIFMKRKQMSFSDIGKAIGVSKASAVRLLRADSVPSYRYAQLVRADIPAVLLPPAKDIAPGPKPKKSITASTADTEPNHLGQAA